MSHVTRLLNAMNEGDREAAAELYPLVYAELRTLARQHMARERGGHTLQATALVNEAYLRLVGDEPEAKGKGQRWQSRAHFFAAVAEAMRRILIEHARRKNAQRRGGNREREEIAPEDLPAIASPCDGMDILALDEALARLGAVDAEKVELVKLLFFAGLNLNEAAAVLGISRSTAHRRWLFARAWLYRAMNGPAGPE